MIQHQTILKVIDNSGAKTVKCIKVLGGFKKKYSFLGEVIIVSVRNLRNKSKITSKVKKGEVYQALVIRTKSSINKKSYKLFFNQNCVCLINKQGKPISTRIIGPLPSKLKKNKYIKLVSLSSGFV